MIKIKCFPISVSIMISLIMISGCEKNDEELKDKDGNVYTSVTIGTQIWMVENLKTTKYNDGTAIPLVTGMSEWVNLTTPGYCYYDNDATTYKNTYGTLYNWHAINTGKLCPSGWHVPTDVEWTTLTDYLGGYTVAGAKLKETGITHWKDPNTGATNETRFTALPGGHRTYINGEFLNIGLYGIWWSATESVIEASYAYCWHTDYDTSNMDNIHSPKENGISVRCVRD
jgi:uncharacterized protein (TIGR02145 family)